jgi:hypothetical protein
MIDFDNLWNSDKLASCDSSVRAEYLWLYGLADANGSFELNLRANHSKVSAIRPRLTLQRLKHIFAELEAHGLMFTWQENGKCYAHWTKSEAPGRLPPAKERHRYKRFAPDVPVERLREYESRFNHDAIATTSPLGVGVGVELDRKGVGDGDGSGVGAGEGGGAEGETLPAQIGMQPHTNGKPKPQEKSPVEEKDEDKFQFNCRFCQNSFPNARKYAEHRCTAKTAAGNECRKCHSTFKTFAELRDHFSGCPEPEIPVQPTVTSARDTIPRTASGV